MKVVRKEKQENTIEPGTYSAIGKWIERQEEYGELKTAILLSDLETEVYPHEFGSSAFPPSMKFIINCCHNMFAGRQLTPPPNLAPLRADNGAVVVQNLGDVHT